MVCMLIMKIVFHCWVGHIVVNVFVHNQVFVDICQKIGSQGKSGVLCVSMA